MLLKVVSPKEKYKDDDIYQSIVNYTTRKSKCRSGYVITRNLNRDSIAKDMSELAEKFGKKKGTRIRHSVVSFESQDNATPEKVAAIAEEACDYYAGDYQVFAAVHEDTENLHFHMVMNPVNIHDGKKYTGRKKDYYAFQNRMRAAGRKNHLKFKAVKSL